MNIKPAYLMAGGILAATVAALYLLKKPGEAGTAIGGAAVDMADGIVSGVVVGIGEKVGIPATNLTECERAKAEGRTWDASFACPAGDFLKYVWS